MKQNADLTEEDYEICIRAITKCQLLNSYVKSGLPYTVTDKNFGFADLTKDEETILIDKLRKASKLAWLKESKE